MRVVEIISARLPTNLTTKGETMIKFGTKLNLYAVYYAHISGVLYEAFVNRREIVLRADSNVVARFPDEDSFLRFAINGATIGGMIDDGTMRPAEFATTPVPV